MDGQTIRQMNVSRGVISLKIPSYLGTDNLINDAVSFAKSEGYIKEGENLVCILAQNEESPDYSNIMKVTQA